MQATVQQSTLVEGAAGPRLVLAQYMPFRCDNEGVGGSDGVSPRPRAQQRQRSRT